MDRVQTTVLEAYETTLVSNNVVSGDAVAVTIMRLRLLRRSLRDQSSSEESEENKLSKSRESGENETKSVEVSKYWKKALRRAYKWLLLVLVIGVRIDRTRLNA